MQASGSYPKTAEIIKEMPYTGVKTRMPAQNGKKAKTTTTWTPTGDLNIDPSATPEEAHEAFIEHAKSNILALHDAVPDDIRQGSMQWYDGANTIASNARSNTTGRSRTSRHFAALSPQMDWYKNASLGDRVMDISHRQGNTAFSAEMRNWVNGYLTNRAARTPPNRRRSSTDQGHAARPDSPTPGAGALDRAYDEAHNRRAYNLVNPDGTFGDTVKKKDWSRCWGRLGRHGRHRQRRHRLQREGHADDL